MGRAYDPSEITGDQGLAGTVELRYTGFAPLGSISASPYGFYDIGKVWNKGLGEDQSASSAGAGLIFAHDNGLSLDTGIAFPLTRDIDTPLYGDEENPRLYVKTQFRF